MLLSSIKVLVWSSLPVHYEQIQSISNLINGSRAPKFLLVLFSFNEMLLFLSGIKASGIISKPTSVDRPFISTCMQRWVKFVLFQHPVTIKMQEQLVGPKLKGSLGFFFTSPLSLDNND